MKIAAIFATMNRADTAAACVRALAAQSRPPDVVVVADNRSTDDTLKTLNELTNLPFHLDVIPLPENTGNAGGVAAAMERAFSTGADAVWILDDDSWPRPSALAALLDNPWDGKSVHHAHQVNPLTGKFSWPLEIMADDGSWKFVGSFNEMPDTTSIRSRYSWTGALIPQAIRQSVGPVNAALFIRGEDEEYPLRIERAGFPFFACRNAILDHPGPGELIKWKFLNRRLFYERNIQDWKIYYKVRNMVWLKKQFEGPLTAAIMALGYILATITLERGGKIKLIAEATLDGWNNRLGKWKNHP